jgi:hypothetical protein
LTVIAEVEASILARCARHRCIYRKFKPLHLQIHHILPRAQGGNDFEENLAPICLDCHSAVHSKLSMAKNFSELELKLARNEIYELAKSGRLHGAMALSDSELGKIADAINKELSSGATTKQSPLSRRATEILLASVAENMPVEALVETASFGDAGAQSTSTVVRCGLQEFSISDGASPNPQHEIQELLRAELIASEGEALLPTAKAFKMLQVVRVDNDVPSYFVKKFQRRECDLHFALYTQHPDQHQLSNLHCPECGQNSGRFYIWWQKLPGFIFQTVPGHATFYAGI